MEESGLMFGRCCKLTHIPSYLIPSAASLHAAVLVGRLGK